nr:hypothetical protein [Aeromonas caviae]
MWLIPPSVELAAGLGVDHHEGRSVPCWRRARNQIDQSGLAGLILHHEQLDLFVAPLGTAASLACGVAGGEGNAGPVRSASILRSMVPDT